MTMLMTRFSNSNFCGKKVACSTIRVHYIHEKVTTIHPASVKKIKVNIPKNFETSALPTVILPTILVGGNQDRQF